MQNSVMTSSTTSEQAASESVLSQVSVILITHNEAHNIQDCLASVSWAGEIIIVDSGSTDATLTLAQAYNPRIQQTDWPGFGKQKNRALDLASKPWVLSIDADERVSSELKQEIEQVLENQQFRTS